jgi:hypothetical protein
VCPFPVVSFFRITQYNADAHNTHAHSPLWIHERKPYPYENLRRTEHQQILRFSKTRKYKTTMNFVLICKRYRCPGISGYIDLQRSLQVDICIIQYDNPALEWDVSQQKRSQWISHFKEASARYAASSLPFVSFQVFKLATAQPCFNIHHTSTM